MNKPHVSVLLTEVVTALGVEPGKHYIDCTLGAAGHTRAILERGGQVLGIDTDPVALELVQREIMNPNLTLVEGNFVEIEALAKANGFDKVDGILYDLGVSSMQFDMAYRGFSFREEAPLDMRMSPTLKITAQDLVNSLSEGELYEIFTVYAQEEAARKIAKSIIEARREKPIRTTTELAELIERAKPQKHSSIHPATKVFQALRIAVNDELTKIKESLPQAARLLKKGGALAVISFHEGEDRLVKRFMKKAVESGEAESFTKNPIVPTPAEVVQNHRARSAKLRVLKK